MRKSKSEELSGILGPLCMDLFQALTERGITLTMADMMALMQRMERKAAELTANGNGIHTTTKGNTE